MEGTGLRSERGQGLVEYALLLSFVVVLAAAIVGGDTIRDAFATTMNSLAALFE